MPSHRYGPLDAEPQHYRAPFDVYVPEPPPHRDRSHGAFEAWRQRRRDERIAALVEPLEGLPLGAYDRQVLAWLAGFDNATVGTVVSLLHRARATAPLPRQREEGP
jgi:hypothetical protein